MKRLQNELNALVNRGLDRHLRLAVTGMSRSGKTAFITSLVNQLLMANHGARLPLFNVAREGRLLGVRRVQQRNLGLSCFTYDEGIAALSGSPPAPGRYRPAASAKCVWRCSTGRGMRYGATSKRPARCIWRLSITPENGCWICPCWSKSILPGRGKCWVCMHWERATWAAPWLSRGAELDPLAPADERALAAIAQPYTDYLLQAKAAGLHFIQPGRFVLPGDMAGIPALQFFPWPRLDDGDESRLARADRRSNIGMLRDRYRYYCQQVVKCFYKQHFSGFDRQNRPGGLFGGA